MPVLQDEALTVNAKTTQAEGHSPEYRFDMTDTTTSAARILVVDDDAAVRAGLRRSLVRHFKADVAEAANGVLALEHLVRHPCDLVLLDLKMPVLDGLKTLQTIRKSPRRDIPVVMLTGMADAQQVKEALRLGVVHYLVKPVDASELVERLSPLLTREDVAGAPPQRIDAAAEAASSLVERLMVAAATGVRRSLEQMTGRHVQSGANVVLQDAYDRRWAVASLPLDVNGRPWEVSVFTTMTSAATVASKAVETETVTGDTPVSDTLGWLARVAGDGVAEFARVTGHQRPRVTCDLPRDPSGGVAQGEQAQRWLFVPTSGIAVLVRVSELAAAA